MKPSHRQRGREGLKAGCSAFQCRL